MTVDVKTAKKDEKSDPEVPQDRFHIVFILVFVLGLVHLLPWSFFTTATKYWMYKFRNTTIDDDNSEFRTSLQAQFHAAILITLQVSEVTFLVIGLLFGKLISVRTRFVGILSTNFVLFVGLTAFVKIDTDSWQGGFFGLVIVITAVINSMNAVFTVTIFTTISRFPQRFLASYLLGSALARIFTSSLQIVSLATGLSVQDSALVYFCLGLVVVIITLAFLVVVTSRNDFYHHHMRGFQEKGHRVSFRQAVHLFRKIWPSVAMMGLYFISSNMAPVALVVSENEGGNVWSDVYFVPTITFLLTAICDWIGRSISIRYTPNLHGLVWVVITLVRTALVVPLTMFANAQPRNHLPVLLPHDYQYIILTVVSAISGGYLVNHTSYNIRSLVDKEELKDAYHVFMLLTGLEMGLLSVLSIVSVRLL